MKSGLGSFLAVLSLLLCPTCTWTQTPPAPGGTGPLAIDESQLVPLKGNVHFLAQPQFDRGPAPRSEATGRIQLLLRRNASQQQALTQYLAELQNPSSAAFHKWLTPAQYGQRFGADPADIQTIESWLQSHGLHVEKVPLSGNRITFSGTIDQIQNTFHTSIHTFAAHGEVRFANITDPQIPEALSALIAGVGPLNNFRPQPESKITARGTWNSTTHSVQPQLTLFGSNNSPYLFVDPADSATIYDSPNSALNPNYTGTTSYTGKGATIGIVGVSNIDMQDIQNFRTGFLGEAASSANVPTVIIDGNDPGVDSTGAGVEAILDNEVAGGLAPGAQIDFYISAGSDLSDGLLNAIARAVDDNTVDILSISFGECEASLGTSGNQLVNELSEQASAQGMTVTVSSGDGGSAGCDNFDTATTAQSGFAVNGFASTPYSIAVGGTDFDVLPSSFSIYASSNTSGTPPYYRTATQYIPEKPWNDSTRSNASIAQNLAYTDSSGKTNIIAGAGGVSTIYSKPSFQSSLTPADNQRDLPDVSLLAGNGFYSATWVVCSDALADGTSQWAASDCTNNGGQFQNNATFTGVGGTSAAAPAFAGILALAVQATGGRLGQADSVLYQLAQAHPTYFHDITSGDNSVPCTSGSLNCGSNGFLSGYNAGVGYDLATGLGSVDAAAIVNHWKSVSLGSTSTTLQIDSSSASYSGVHGANLTFSSGVTGSGGNPTGIVAITDNADMTLGGTTSGPQSNGQIAIPLTSGSGSVTYNGLPGGTYQVTARYGGDTSYAASTSTPISVSISAEPSTTALTVDAYDPATMKPISTTNIPYGYYVFADAVIDGTAEGSKTQGAATGKVQFLNGSTVLGSSSVSSGNEASWPPLNSAFIGLPAGTYSLTAQYSGDASYSPSAGTANFTIAKAPTTTSAGFAQNTVGYGSQEQIAADAFTNSYGVAPTGTFQFSVDGQPVLAPQSIYESEGYYNGNGKNNWAWADAQTTYAFTSLGQHTLAASYSGDTNYTSSASASVSISVIQAQPFFTTYGWNPPAGTTPALGQQTTAAATLYGAQQGVAPTGTVTFYDNGNAIAGTVTYTGQAASRTVGSLLTASIPYTFTTAGPHALSTTYSGDVNYLPAASSGSATVNVPGPFALAANAITITAPGQSGSSTVTITPSGGFTGEVTLSCTGPTTADKMTCGFGSGSTVSATVQVPITGPAATATFTVGTTAPQSASVQPGWRSGGIAFAVLLIAFVPRKGWRRKISFMVLGAVILLGQTSCGGGSSTSGGGGGTGGGTTVSGTPQGTYPFTVTATGGSGANAYSTSIQVFAQVQ